MKRFFLLALAFFSFNQANAGWTSHTSEFEGKSRQYKIYKPSNLAPSAKIVVLLHGLGATMNDFDLSSWPAIADTANIILISPQGLPFENQIVGTIQGVFNSGMILDVPFLGQIPINSDVNDVGFISALIDTVMSTNNIDGNRIYATGFSNGGFMTQRLACELTHRFSAVASVSGTRAQAFPACGAGTYLPVIHFHGDADSVVRLDGFVSSGAIGDYLGITVDSLLNYWAAANQATISSQTIVHGDSNSNLYAESTFYKDNNDKTVLQYCLIYGGEHRYYGYNSTDNGFDIADLSWTFFNQHQTPGTLEINPIEMHTYSLYPNPASDFISWKGEEHQIQEVVIYSITGSLIHSQTNHFDKINVSHLQAGVYLVECKFNNGLKVMKKMLKN